MFAAGDGLWAEKDKSRWAKPADVSQGNSGYVAPGVENFNPHNISEAREAFNFTPAEGHLEKVHREL